MTFNQTHEKRNRKEVIKEEASQGTSHPRERDAILHDPIPVAHLPLDKTIRGRGQVKKEETADIRGVSLQTGMTAALGESVSLMEAVRGQGNVIEQAPLKLNVTKVEGHHGVEVQTKEEIDVNDPIRVIKAGPDLVPVIERKDQSIVQGLTVGTGNTVDEENPILVIVVVPVPVPEIKEGGGLVPETGEEVTGLVPGPGIATTSSHRMYGVGNGNRFI